jgi:four helix bundle protein
MARFDPEKMAVYRLARRHNRAVHALLTKARTRGFADLVAQLRRSSISVPANILEAAGEWRPGKRLHYLMIAKGSTWECWAHIDSMVDFGLVRPQAIAEVRVLQGEITALLITTIRRLEAELRAKKGTGSRADVVAVGEASPSNSNSNSKSKSNYSEASSMHRHSGPKTVEPVDWSRRPGPRRPAGKPGPALRRMVDRRSSGPARGGCRAPRPRTRPEREH